MIAIYRDSQILELEWLPELNFGGPVQYYSNFDAYRDCTATKKYAFTMHRLHCDLNEDSPAYQGFEEKIIALSECSDLVFTFESELHNYHWQMWDRCHRNNVYWVLPGKVNDADEMNDHLVFWGHWFKTTVEVYKELPHKLNEINPYATKPKYFDALLGSPKPHRDFVSNSVVQEDLKDKFVMTYGGKWDDNKFFAEDYFIWEPDCVPVGKIIGTADWVDYCGLRTCLSRVIPIQVFNDTSYSIIAETDHDNTLSFFSEKTAKPLIAKRLFVAFTGYKFLKNLRSVGFKTFNGIIDESYDLIENDNERYAAAFDQVKKLCSMDQQEVYNKIKDIVEYNHNHIMNTNWTRYGMLKIQSLLNTSLAQSA